MEAVELLALNAEAAQARCWAFIAASQHAAAATAERYSVSLLRKAAAAGDHISKAVEPLHNRLCAARDEFSSFARRVCASASKAFELQIEEMDAVEDALEAYARQFALPLQRSACDPAVSLADARTLLFTETLPYCPAMIDVPLCDAVRELRAMSYVQSLSIAR